MNFHRISPIPSFLAIPNSTSSVGESAHACATDQGRMKSPQTSFPGKRTALSGFSMSAPRYVRDVVVRRGRVTGRVGEALALELALCPVILNEPELGRRLQAHLPDDRVLVRS